MSAPQSNAAPWLQELKTNRKTQAALAFLVIFLGWFFWPDSKPQGRPRATLAARISGRSSEGEAQLRAIEQLPDLEQLNKAGELPKDTRMFRDLFVFDSPPPPPPPPPRPKPTPPPPPPPTAEQLKAMELKRLKDAEWGSRPQDLRYLGYLATRRTGKIGAFMKGEEPVSIRLGDKANAQWKLVKLTDVKAEFQNLKYQDLILGLDAKDVQGTGPATRTTNEF
jgi:type IV secretory pathway VirB10-like protein